MDAAVAGTGAPGRIRTALVAVDGDVDAATIEHLQEARWPRLSAAVDTLVVELTEVGLLGVTGLHLWHQAYLWAYEPDLALGLVLAGGKAERAAYLGDWTRTCRAFPQQSKPCAPSTSDADGRACPAAGGRKRLLAVFDIRGAITGPSNSIRSYGSCVG